jgi:hypothetical protein
VATRIPPTLGDEDEVVLCLHTAECLLCAVCMAVGGIFSDCTVCVMLIPCCFLYCRNSWALLILRLGEVNENDQTWHWTTSQRLTVVHLVKDKGIEDVHYWR